MTALPTIPGGVHPMLTRRGARCPIPQFRGAISREGHDEQQGRVSHLQKVVEDPAMCERNTRREFKIQRAICAPPVDLPAMKDHEHMHVLLVVPATAYRGSDVVVRTD
jgi:hypothetical protein